MQSLTQRRNFFFIFQVNQVDSENLSSCPYTLLTALKEGYFTDITFIASNGEKVIIFYIFFFKCVMQFGPFSSMVDMYDIDNTDIFSLCLFFRFQLTRQFCLVSLLMFILGTEFLLFLRTCLQMCSMLCFTTCILVLCQVISSMKLQDSF